MAKFRTSHCFKSERNFVASPFSDVQGLWSARQMLEQTKTLWGVRRWRWPCSLCLAPITFGRHEVTSIARSSPDLGAEAWDRPVLQLGL